MTTFVLIHGSYQGGWIWQRVANRLRAAGHRVHAPSLDGCAERKHALRPGITTETQTMEIADLLFYEDLRDVVMVGTSSGGMVVCRAAEVRRDRIARVVFVDALALLDGERIRDIVRRSTAVPSGLAAGPTREDAETRLFADLEPETRSWALERYTLHPIGIYENPDAGCSVRAPRSGSQARTLHPASDRHLRKPGEARQFLEPAMAGYGDLVSPSRQSGRSTPASH